MSVDLAIGIKVGFGAGAAVAGLTSLKRSMNMLGDEGTELSARQRMLGEMYWPICCTCRTAGER